MRQRRDLLVALRSLTNAQQDAIQTSEPSITLGILARKSSLLDELSEVHYQLIPFHHDDPELRTWATPERRQLCRQLADEGQQLLREIIAVEQATVDAVSTQRDAVAAQLQDGTDSIIASNAYTAGDLLNQSTLDLSNL